jgi:hypothetical protein
MNRSHTSVCAILVATLGLLMATPAQAASWQSSYAFGATLKGDLYKPTTPAAHRRPSLWRLHYCGGSGANAQGWFQSGG